uniref:Uncharacterized protein n=1 Tax=Glossina pallidipes TaxID=7398 RepID=A0A1A9ZWG8_GLOPL
MINFMKYIRSWQRNLLLISVILSTAKTLYAVKSIHIKALSSETAVTPPSSINSDMMLKKSNESDMNADENTSHVQLAYDDDDDDELTSLSTWNVMRRILHWAKNDISKSLWHNQNNISSMDVRDGRTFGKIRRLQMALIPLAFKFGVLFTMVAFLVMLGMKTLFLVKTLVLLNVAALLGKFLTFKFPQTQEHHIASPSAYGWNPHAQAGWPALESLHHGKEIHLHIHGANVDTVPPQISPYSVSGVSHRPGWERKFELIDKANELQIPFFLSVA